ncbi:holin [Alkalicoccobacillus plakortidis]|uniref:Holin n=1 Tax=Alkalicoccobacillus plakortidis TaxID=444060 RepID=A0ABT0XED1_9BACI|nr:holin [Alkalicoccobacillus plakortidis]MCM2674257.1 holin [Alkalicoccobacillus plakortidis]
MEIILMLATVISPVVLAIIELLKRTVNLPKRFLPLIAVGVGLIVGGLSFPFTDLDLAMRLWAGGLAGLSATGLFEISKNREGSTFDKHDE